jgi:hypothetical protein
MTFVFTNLSRRGHAAPHLTYMFVGVIDSRKMDYRNEYYREEAIRVGKHKVA